MGRDVGTEIDGNRGGGMSGDIDIPICQHVYPVSGYEVKCRKCGLRVNPHAGQEDFGPDEPMIRVKGNTVRHLYRVELGGKGDQTDWVIAMDEGEASKIVFETSVGFGTGEFWIDEIVEEKMDVSRIVTWATRQ